MSRGLWTARQPSALPPRPRREHRSSVITLGRPRRKERSRRHCAEHHTAPSNAIAVVAPAGHSGSTSRPYVRLATATLSQTVRVHHEPDHPHCTSSHKVHRQGTAPPTPLHATQRSAQSPHNDADTTASASSPKRSPSPRQVQLCPLPPAACDGADTSVSRARSIFLWRYLLPSNSLSDWISRQCRKERSGVTCTKSSRGTRGTSSRGTAAEELANPPAEREGQEAQRRQQESLPARRKYAKWLPRCERNKVR